MHVALQKNDFGHAAQKGDWGREMEHISHLPFVCGKREEEMIVLHETEDALSHGVLEIRRAIHRRYLAGEPLPYAKVFRPPSDALAHCDQSGGHAGSRYGGLSPMHIAGQMHFDASGEIEASLNGGVDNCRIFELNRHIFERVQL